MLWITWRLGKITASLVYAVTLSPRGAGVPHLRCTGLPGPRVSFQLWMPRTWPGPLDGPFPCIEAIHEPVCSCPVLHRSNLGQRTNRENLGIRSPSCSLSGPVTLP